MGGIVTDLYRHNGGAPAELPAIAHDADGNAYTPPYVAADLTMLGFVKAPKRPAETATQTTEWDAGAEKWVMVDRPPAPPAPEPEPRVIGKGEFLDLFLGAGVPLSKIREASDDAHLADFWWALNNFYTQIRRDHPSTNQGIGAMVTLGHVTQAQADAVLAGWPVG